MAPKKAELPGSPTVVRKGATGQVGVSPVGGDKQAPSLATTALRKAAVPSSPTIVKRGSPQVTGSPPVGDNHALSSATTASSPKGIKKGSSLATEALTYSGVEGAESHRVSIRSPRAAGSRLSLSAKTPSLVTSALPAEGVTGMLHVEDAQCGERAAGATTVNVASSISTLSFMAAGALAEIHRVFDQCDMMRQDPSKKMVREIMLARGNNIVLHGVGREGLMMRALTMRLFHLGLRASCLGDMTCPKLGPGDLFIASSGPGNFSSVNALMITAKEAGAKVMLVTAQPEGDASKVADVVAWLPAQTMKDEDPAAGQLPVDRPWDCNSLPGRPKESLHAFNSSYKGTDSTDRPLSESAPGMVDKKKEEAKAKAKKKLEDDIVAGKGPKDSAKVNKDKKEKKDKEDIDPKSLSSKKSGGKVELEVGGMSIKERTPHYIIPLDGCNIDRETIAACKGDSESMCLLDSNKILPMGSVYEGALYILFEIITHMLRGKLGETVEGMCARHTNME